MHTRDVLLDLGNGLGRLGDLPPERAAVCLRLLGGREQVRHAGIRLGHRGHPSTLQRVTGKPRKHGATMPPHLSDLLAGASRSQ